MHVFYFINSYKMSSQISSKLKQIFQILQLCHKTNTDVQIINSLQIFTTQTNSTQKHTNEHK